MKKIITFLILLLLVPILLFSDNTRTYPDYQKIIENTNLNLREQAEYYEQFREVLGDSKNMDNYDVTYYKIDIEIDILLEFIESEITMQALICEDQTTEIEMNFTNNLTITDIQQNGTPLSFVHTDDIITIQLDDTYNIDDMIEIIVNYEGYPDTKLSD